MFIGHLATGFAAKKAAPCASLHVALLAAGFVDVLFSVFVLLGVEVAEINPGHTAVVPVEFLSYPWSHSLVMMIAWAAVFGGAYLWKTGYKRGAAVMAALVVLHWPLDWASHAPDMQLAPWIENRYGLSLWDSEPATALVELVMFGLGVWAYSSETSAPTRKGTLALWSFVAFVLALYAMSFVSPPPPSLKAMALANLLFLPSLLWARWAERSRELRGSCAA